MTCCGKMPRLLSCAECLSRSRLKSHNSFNFHLIRRRWWKIDLHTQLVFRLVWTFEKYEKKYLKSFIENILNLNSIIIICFVAIVPVHEWERRRLWKKPLLFAKYNNYYWNLTRDQHKNYYVQHSHSLSRYCFVSCVKILISNFSKKKCCSRSRFLDSNSRWRDVNLMQICWMSFEISHFRFD